MRESYTDKGQLNHHLYNPVNPSRENLLPHQKQIQELFIPEHVREDLAKKAEAARQVLPSKSCGAGLSL